MSEVKTVGKGGRKRVRCEECRKSHKKCDQQKPKCGNCVFRGWACVYPEVERNRNREEESFQDRQRVYQFTEWRPPPQMIPSQMVPQAEQNFYQMAGGIPMEQLQHQHQHQHHHQQHQQHQHQHQPQHHHQHQHQHQPQHHQHLLHHPEPLQHHPHQLFHQTPQHHHIPQIHTYHQQPHQSHIPVQPLPIQASASEPRPFTLPACEPVPLPSSSTEPASLHLPSQLTQIKSSPKLSRSSPKLSRSSQNKMEISFLLH